MRLGRHLVLFLLLLIGASCKSGRPGEQAPMPPTTRLRVENRNFLDHTIYVLRGSERIRLGVATGSSTSTFKIPANLVFGGTSLRFMADPIGARGQPVSDEIMAHPGDVVALIIPPS